MEIHIKKGLDALQTETVLRLLSQTVWACNRIISICIYYKAIAKPAEPVNGQDADFRHRGVGASLLKAITAEDTYRSLLGMLITEEAEQFYEPFGFRKDPICFMTRKETPEAITNE